MTNNIQSPVQEVEHLAMGSTKKIKFMGVNGKIYIVNIIFSTLLCINIHLLCGVISFFFIHMITVMKSIKGADYLNLNTNITKMPPILNRWHVDYKADFNKTD